MSNISPSELDALINASSSFGDYSHFEGDPAGRRLATEAFVNGDSYAPVYTYPRLDHLHDGNDVIADPLAHKKSETYHAILELEAYRNAGKIAPDLYELYASYHEVRLRKMMMVAAAERLLRPGTSADQVVARQEFMGLNAELYGFMNKRAFDGIMNTERARLDHFDPVTPRAKQLKIDLSEYFSRREFAGTEAPLLDRWTIEASRKVITRRYGHILEVVPDTPDEIMYDAADCAAIMTAALKAGGLADRGWKVEVRSQKLTPATNGDTKKIYLPASLRRNATQLKRLIIHEQEVHARRGQNGADMGVMLLKKGTSKSTNAEEGLGVMLECLVTDDQRNQSFDRARDRYITAGLAFGTDGMPRDAAATFDLLWRLIALRSAENGVLRTEGVVAAKQQAYVHVENAFRGTNFAMPGVFYMKLKVYYEGFVKNAAFFRDNIDRLDDALDAAMIGKYDHTDSAETKLVRQLAA